MTTFSSKKGFTLIELLGGIFIIFLVLVAVLGMIRAATGHINKIRQETIAINLAREGVEAVYTRRNTNWLKWSSQKDIYWLCANVDEDNNHCTAWFQRNNLHSSQNEGVYPHYVWILDYKEFISGGIKTKVPVFRPYPFNKDTLNPNEISIRPSFARKNIPEEFKSYHKQAKVDLGDQFEGTFSRYIDVQGIYDKKNLTPFDDKNPLANKRDTCVQYLTPEKRDNHREFDNGYNPSRSGALVLAGNKAPGEGKCGMDGNAAEMVFCSVVTYEGLGEGKVELCSSITNYKE